MFQSPPTSYNQESHKDTQLDFPCRWFHMSVARWDGAIVESLSKQSRMGVNKPRNLWEWLYLNG